MFHSFNLFLQTQPNFTSPKASTPFLSKLHFMTMKRGITELRELDHSLTMANCLMLLSRGTNEYESFSNMQSHNPIRVFECKTCNRQFPSFQALGGHRASHKKPRMTASGDGNSTSSDQSQSPSKPKTHECNVCGLEFAIGQALGGHMRRHRTANNLSSSTDHLINGHDQSNSFLSLSSPPPPPPPTQVVMKRANSSRRVFSLDLNLTPLENDMEILGLRKAAAPALSIVFSN